jgi:hypothetical protein
VLALSIRQPWAWLIIHAGKDIENRDWPTRYRGPILVHAGKGMTRDEYDDALQTQLGVSQAAGILPKFEDLERGGFVGSVEIVDCVTRSSSPWFFGRYGFVLANPKPLPFVPYKGQLSLFSVPDTLYPQGSITQGVARGR